MFIEKAWIVLEDDGVVTTKDKYILWRDLLFMEKGWVVIEKVFIFMEEGWVVIRRDKLL